MLGCAPLCLQIGKGQGPGVEDEVLIREQIGEMRLALELGNREALTLFTHGRFAPFFSKVGAIVAPFQQKYKDDFGRNARNKECRIVQYN